MRRLGLICLLLIGLTGCAKHAAVCLSFGEAGHGTIKISAGPWGEVGEVNITGPSNYVRIPKDFTFNPCGAMPPP